MRVSLFAGAAIAKTRFAEGPVVLEKLMANLNPFDPNLNRYQRHVMIKFIFIACYYN